VSARRRSRRGEEGFSLVGLLAAATITLILMGAAVPAWKYVDKNEREEELLFRGVQIKLAIERYQKDPKNGGTLPPSLEVLVKGKYLRKLYKDPMTKSGKWRFIRPGEGVPIPGAPGGPSSPAPSAAPSAPPSASPGGLLGSLSGGAEGSGIGAGPIQGVASTSTEKSLRIVNGQERYSNWKFIPNVDIVIGKQRKIGVGGQPGGQPGNLPGQPGNTPGQPGNVPGQPGNMPGQQPVPGQSPSIQ
jgi:type II secretory pathway pseudopilin PulG